MGCRHVQLASIFEAIYSLWLSICIYLLDWKNQVKLWIFIIVVEWNCRNIILLEPFMCLDLSHCDPLHRVGLKNSLEKILCTKRKALWDLSVTLENLEHATAKVMSLIKWHQRSTRTELQIIHFYLNKYLLIKNNDIPVIKWKVSYEHHIKNDSTRPDIWQGSIVSSVLQNLQAFGTRIRNCAAKGIVWPQNTFSPSYLFFFEWEFSPSFTSGAM